MTTWNSVGIGDRGSGIRWDPADHPIPDPRSPIPDESLTRRVVVERVQPEIDGGRFPIKRTIGESIVVVADAFADGHDLLAGVVKYRGPHTRPRDAAAARRSPDGGGGPAPADDDRWREVPLEPLGNDGWAASFTVTDLGTYEYTVEAWVDHFGTWLKGLVAKFEAAQDVSSELLEGATLVQAAAGRLKPAPTSDSRY